MKRYLLPKDGNFYKANMHCHTDISDGSYTPEEIKEIYKSHGYSIVAYTDHDLMLDHDDLRDDEFLPLMGYEIEINERRPDDENPFYGLKSCHLNLIALDRENTKQVCWHRSRYQIGHGWSLMKYAKFDDSLPDYVREYSKDGLNDIVKKGREGGFFVTFNHPKWSMMNYSDYIGFEGLNALEICNGGSWNAGYDDYCPEVYDDLLRAGKRIGCVGGDDNHGNATPERDLHDFFHAFTVIKAEKLEYKEVTQALLDGNYYASMGPEIHELYVEDGIVHIKCSPAACITINKGIRGARAIRSKNGELLTEASFKIEPKDIYFRLTVDDGSGKCANTNAYFTDEIF